MVFCCANFTLLILLISANIIFCMFIISNNNFYANAAVSSKPDGINCGINPHAPPCCLQPTKDPVCLSASKILLNNIYTIPSVIHVNDRFFLNATVFNGSPNTIKAVETAGGCVNPLKAAFDKNVKNLPGPPGPTCPTRFPSLKPGQSATLSTSLWRGIDVFLATSAGVVNAKLQLNYQIENQSIIVSKCLTNEKRLSSPCSFQFTILPAESK
jgi:hypothetical protein